MYQLRLIKKQLKKRNYHGERKQAENNRQDIKNDIKSSIAPILPDVFKKQKRPLHVIEILKCKFTNIKPIKDKIIIYGKKISLKKLKLMLNSGFYSYKPVK